MADKMAYPPAPIELYLKSRWRGVRDGFSYPFVGAMLLSDSRFPLLDYAFQRVNPISHEFTSSIPDMAMELFDHSYVVEGLLANVMGKITVQVNRNWYHLAIDKVGEFLVAADGKFVQLIKSDPDIDSSIFQNHALGSPLILALACQGTYCLHASGVIMNGQVIAFCGASGSGKSTTAAYIASKGFSRAADDVLPLRLGEGGKPYIIPCFPQVGMKPEENAVLREKRLLPLGGLFLLEESQAEDPAAEKLSERSAMTVVLSQTMGSRLYDRRIKTRHLDMAKAAASMVPVWRITIPRRLSVLPAVLEIVRGLA